MNAVPRVRLGLLKHSLDKQVLVYDPRDERVHLLDPITSFVLELLEEGGWSLDKMTSEIARRHSVAPDSAFVALAMDELRRAGLLDESAPVPSPLVDVTRRDLVRKLAMTGAAALLVPAVATLSATRGYAQSIQGIAGGPCTTASQCGPGLVCCGSLCASACNVPVGGACPNGNSQCASGICCSGICASVPCGSVASCGSCQTSGECSGGLSCDNRTVGVGICGGGTKTANGGSCRGNGNCCSGNCFITAGHDSGTCMP